MAVYEIRVKGHLDGRWSEWFDELEITIVDQAALHGVTRPLRSS